MDVDKAMGLVLYARGRVKAARDLGMDPAVQFEDLRHKLERWSYTRQYTDRERAALLLTFETVFRDAVEPGRILGPGAAPADDAEVLGAAAKRVVAAYHYAMSGGMESRRSA